MRRSLLISFALHALVLLGLVLSGGLARDRQYPPVYRVNLIAAPPGPVMRQPSVRRAEREPEPEPEPQPATTPEPEPPILEEEEELVPEENAEPAPERPEPAEEAPEEQPAAEQPTANPTPEAGGNDAALDLEIEGEPFPFPGYLERMVNKIAREWQRTENRRPLRALVYFRVERSGRVGGTEVQESSGDFLFDQAALRAVADASPMPPLPDGYTGDYLGVYFDFNEETR
jgi:TonB family protein